MKIFKLFIAALFAVSVSGCPSSSGEAVVPSDAEGDFDHDHEHTHGEGIAHDHSHGDYAGSHEHGHSHGHRHAEPKHGGKIVSIGHTHHAGGVDEFHAEVLSDDGHQITLYTLKEQADGDFAPAPVDDDSFDAVVGPESDDKGLLARSITFERKGEASNQLFVAELDEHMQDHESLLVVVPRITLGGERLNFSFVVSLNAPDEHAHDDHAHEHKHGDETHTHSHAHDDDEHQHAHDAKTGDE